MVERFMTDKAIQAATRPVDSGSAHADSYIRTGTEALDYGLDGLRQLHEALQAEPLRGGFARAVETILGMEGRLIVVGVGKSGHIGSKLAATFASTGTPAFFVHPSEASHGDLGMISTKDIILALSWSGQTAELRDLVGYAKRQRVPLLSITSAADSMLAQASDTALILPKAREACPLNLAPTTSTMLQLALGDALAMALLNARGFTASNFQEFHPGGKLGISLQPVSSVMVTGEMLPTVSAESTVAAAIERISSNGFGIVGILDDGGVDDGGGNDDGGDEAGGLMGVITDGDLRRYMQARAEQTVDDALNSVRAVDIMTRQPVMVATDTMVASVLAVMQEKQISAVFVADPHRVGDDARAIGHPPPRGIITFMHLLQLGAV
jgi:arabinose-5-phosphate isomerase